MDSKSVRLDLFRKDPRCHWCKQLTVWTDDQLDDSGATVDHVYPLGHPYRTKKGRRRTGGFQRGSPLHLLACRKCNRKRGNMSVEDFQAALLLESDDFGGEGPTGCMDDGDELSRALRGMSHQDLNRILSETLNTPERDAETGLG